MNKNTSEHKEPSAGAVAGFFMVVAFLIWGWAVLSLNVFAAIMVPIAFLLGVLVMVYGHKMKYGEYPAGIKPRK